MDPWLGAEALAWLATGALFTGELGGWALTCCGCATGIHEPDVLV